MTVEGIGEHAGNGFERGRNAIHEAAYKIQEIIKLTDIDKGTTVTTAVIESLYDRAKTFAATVARIKEM